MITPASRIVLVEDDHDTRLLLERYLAFLPGELCGSFSAGEDAALKAVSLRPDIVLMDIRLGGVMSGLEAGEILHRKGLPIIFLTASDEETDMAAAATYAYGYLVKPVDKRSFLSALRFALHRLEAERRMQASEEKFLLVADAIHAAVLLIENGTITYSNRFANEFLGFDARELTGRAFMDIVHGDSLADAARLAVGSASAELRLRAVAGDKYVYANSVTGGRIGRTLITYVDVTDIRLARTQLEAYAHNLEGEVRRKNSEIIAAERRASVGETALMVGHDLRNPLQALLNSVFLFRSVMERAPEQVLAFMRESRLDEVLKTLEEQVSYVEKAVANLQDFGFSGKPSFQRVSVAELALSLEKELRPPAAISLRCDVDNDLYVEADPPLLKRALLNVLLNAVQSVGAKGKIFFEARRKKNICVITVSDSGPGLSQETADRIFDPLFTTKAKGMGLGLSVAKRIAELHGGTIEAVASRGGGIFRITLKALG